MGYPLIKPLFLSFTLDFPNATNKLTNLDRSRKVKPYFLSPIKTQSFRSVQKLLSSRHSFNGLGNVMIIIIVAPLYTTTESNYLIMTTFRFAFCTSIDALLPTAVVIASGLSTSTPYYVIGLPLQQRRLLLSLGAGQQLQILIRNSPRATSKRHRM